MKKILITGATGFVGGAIICELLKFDMPIIASVRNNSGLVPNEVNQIKISDISSSTNWVPALGGVDVVIHTAARVHVMDDSSADPLTEFRKVNVAGTLNLARQATESGVRRFVFISSIKVNGEATQPSKPFTPEDNITTQDPYGLSKWEAEQGLFEIAEQTGMQVVVIRPPLIYGEGVKANFAKMMQGVAKGLPLPLGAVHNKRSLVALENLVDFIIFCTQHPKAANEVFLISGGEDVSTTELLQKVAKAMGKPSRLMPVPVALMTFVAKLVGKEDVANRLFGSLQVDSSKARELLGWKPVVTMDEQLKKIVEAER
ncbi:MAG: SDR family oxidoreductase [Ghiorsea sp.]|nr:SDR family oxidoreductase [Ghiorsea sp.]